MKLPRTWCLAICLSLALTAGPLQAAAPRLLFQTSTLQALMDGVYDGNLTFQELARHGDFAIGTFNGLDGEMIGLDGTFYQVRADGRVLPVPGAMKTQFAEATFFKADKTHLIEKPLTYQQLTEYITALLPSPNLLYAIKIEGFFPHAKTRSVPRQHRPYPPLVKVAKQQAVFEFARVKGTIVAFRYPAYLASVNKVQQSYL
jgi:acetolactate decarboxylase